MADNILTKDRASADIAIAAKDLAGVLHPRNMLTDSSGADIDPATAGAQAAGNASLATLATVVKNEDTPSADGDPGFVVLGQRRDTDAPAAGTDGDYVTIKLDEEGRVKVSTKPASYPDITGSITAVQATIGTPVAGGTVSGDVSRSSNVMAFCSGTFSTVNCTFEGSLEATGDSNWFGIQAVRSNANTIELTTGNLSAQPAYAWELSVNALARLRVRCTARTSGTQNWIFKQGTYATEPIPAAQVSGTQPVSGTVTANIGTGALAAGTNAIGDVGIQYRASATGAATLTNINCPDTPAAQQLKSGAGRLIGLNLFNTSGSTRWVKIFNLAGASVTPGTTAATTEIGIPAGQRLEFRAEGGAAFSTGITVMITAGAGLTNNGAVTLADVTGFALHA